LPDKFVDIFVYSPLSGGITVDKVTGIKNISTPDGRIVLEISSGSYAFEIKSDTDASNRIINK
jgi:hypothetical protein